MTYSTHAAHLDNTKLGFSLLSLLLFFRIKCWCLCTLCRIRAVSSAEPGCSSFYLGFLFKLAIVRKRASISTTLTFFCCFSNCSVVCPNLSARAFFFSHSASLFVSLGFSCSTCLLSCLLSVVATGAASSFFSSTVFSLVSSALSSFG